MRRRRFSKKATNERREDFMRVLAMNVALACALVAGLIAPAEAQSSLKKLQRCLEFKDMTKPRLDCYDKIVPPRTKRNPGPAQVVNDCRFLKDDDERLICFNRFVETPAERVAPEKPAKEELPEKSAKPELPEKSAKPSCQRNRPSQWRQRRRLPRQNRSSRGPTTKTPSIYGGNG